MEWTITLDEENRYAEIITSGIADKDGSLEMAKAIASTLQNNKWRKILIDHRNISAVKGSTIEVYNRPEQLKAMGVIYSVLIAVVVRPEHSDFFTFLETVCVNRGFSFSIFFDRKLALEWLLSAK